MNPFRQFLGIRHFFGALVPGCVWIAAVVILLAGKGSLVSAARGISASDLTILLGIGFLAGFVLQSFSFRVGTALASSPVLKKKPFNVLRWGHGNTEYYSNYATTVRQKAEAALKEESQVAFQIPEEVKKGIGKTGDGKGKKQNDPDLTFLFCKRTIVERSARLADELEGIEADINLLATLPLPLAFFTLALAYRAFMSWQPAVLCLLVLLLGFALICLALVQLQDMQEGEKTVCFEIFLVLADAPSDQRRPEAKRRERTTAQN